MDQAGHCMSLLNTQGCTEYFNSMNNRVCFILHIFIIVIYYIQLRRRQSRPASTRTLSKSSICRLVHLLHVFAYQGISGLIKCWSGGQGIALSKKLYYQKHCHVHQILKFEVDPYKRVYSNRDLTFLNLFGPMNVRIALNHFLSDQSGI